MTTEIKKNFRASAALSLSLEKIYFCCCMTCKICEYTERKRKIRKYQLIAPHGLRMHESHAHA